jgi:ATP-dependent DNA helicase RecG
LYTATLDSPIEYLKGVGPTRAELLKKELGIFTYKQLLDYYPFRYIDRTRFHKINTLNPDLPLVQIVGRITGKETIGDKHKKRIVAKFTDETGTIELVWFQSLKWVDENVMRGKVYIAFGKPVLFNGIFSISHPDLESYPRPNTATGNLTLQPIYNSTEKLKKRFLDSKGIQKLQSALIEQHLREINETVLHFR